MHKQLLSALPQTPETQTPKAWPLLPSCSLSHTITPVVRRSRCKRSSPPHLSPSVPPRSHLFHSAFPVLQRPSGLLLLPAGEHFPFVLLTQCSPPTQSPGCLLNAGSRYFISVHRGRNSGMLVVRICIFNMFPPGNYYPF